MVIADPAALHGGDGAVQTVVEPTAGEVVASVAVVPQGVVVTMLDNVRGRVYRYRPNAKAGPDDVHGSWSRRRIPFPDNGAVTIAAVNETTGLWRSS